jgi:hypothetical protein
MNIQDKLQELKEMHAKGLISAEVYAEQQKSLLSSHMNTNSASAPSTAQAPTEKPGWPMWQQVLALFLVVFGGIWVAYHFSNREGKDTINQVVARTGIGTQVIPWTDRADTAARGVLAQNANVLATSILNLTHQSGKEPTLIDSSVTKLPDSILVQMTVAWTGSALMGGNYQIIVAWEINATNHVSAKIISDNCPWQATAEDKEKLNDYFRTVAYPGFYNTLVGTAQYR